MIIPKALKIDQKLNELIKMNPNFFIYQSQQEEVIFQIQLKDNLYQSYLLYQQLMVYYRLRVDLIWFFLNNGDIE